MNGKFFDVANVFDQGPNFFWFENNQFTIIFPN